MRIHLYDKDVKAAIELSEHYGLSIRELISKVIQTAQEAMNNDRKENQKQKEQ